MSSALPTIRWQLRECMQAAGIPTVTELHHRLDQVDAGGVRYAQLASMISKPPVRLNLRTLSALTAVLGCRVDDLLVAGVPTSQQERADHV